jgi:hypothetical protein
MEFAALRENMSPEVVRDCEAKGLQYTNVMPAENDPQSGMGRSWQSTLGAKDRDQAEHGVARSHCTVVASHLDLVPPELEPG